MTKLKHDDLKQKALKGSGVKKAYDNLVGDMLKKYIFLKYANQGGLSGSGKV